MSRNEVARRSGGVSLANEGRPEPITNIVSLFEAMAVGWGSGRNRYLLAGDGGQFVRVDPHNFPHHFYNPTPDDIPVVVLNHGYDMRGFIQFEARDLYRGMFETERDDQGVYLIARLTAKGFRFAQAPVFDVHRLHRDIANCSFFNPSTKCPAAEQLGRASVLALAPTNPKEPS